MKTFKKNQKVKVDQCYLDDEATQNTKTSEIATVLEVPSDDEELVRIVYESGLIDHVPQDILTPCDEGRYTFVLFGEKPTSVLGTEGIDALVEQGIDELEGCLDVFDPEMDSVAEILFAADGWNNYAILTEEEFLKLGGEIPEDKRETEKIVVTVRGGVVQCVKKPNDNVMVEVRDYDIESLDPDEEENLPTDEDGDKYESLTF